MRPNAATTPLDVLGDAEYVLLTTFRKDGRAVPTPVWVVRAGEELRVWSHPSTGKLKRIRRSGRCELAPCTLRGVPRGPSVPATARILPDSELRVLLQRLAEKYRVKGWLTTLGPRYLGRPSAGIAITLD